MPSPKSQELADIDLRSRADEALVLEIAVNRIENAGRVCTWDHGRVTPLTSSEPVDLSRPSVAPSIVPLPTQFLDIKGTTG